MSSVKQRVQSLEIKANHRNQPTLMDALGKARAKAIERNQHPPSLEQLEAELAMTLSETEAMEASRHPLTRRMAEARRRAVIPDLQSQIAVLKTQVAHHV